MPADISALASTTPTSLSGTDILARLHYRVRREGSPSLRAIWHCAVGRARWDGSWGPTEIHPAGREANPSLRRRGGRNELGWQSVDTHQEASMAKAYWVAAYRSVSDPDALAAYAKLSGPRPAPANGRDRIRLCAPGEGRA